MQIERDNAASRKRFGLPDECELFSEDEDTRSVKADQEAQDGTLVLLAMHRDDSVHSRTSPISLAEAPLAYLAEATQPLCAKYAESYLPPSSDHAAKEYARSLPADAIEVNESRLWALARDTKRTERVEHC